MSERSRKPWILWVGVPALLVYAALEVYDQRPILAQEAPPPIKTAPGREPFALVELFTSEGCSSCPPAEKLLNEISATARKRKQRVFTLAFHVDYWDHLGWKDPFADPRFTRRQKLYARALKLRSLYTPQMIVNGRTEFVGSRRRSARGAIERALRTPAALALTLQVLPPKRSGFLRIGWQADRSAPNHELRVVLAERGLQTQVLRGENSGRALPHDDVVRSMAHVKLGQALKGELEVAVPKGVKRPRASLVGFVQHPGSRRVLGATRVKFPTATHRARQAKKTPKKSQKAPNR